MKPQKCVLWLASVLLLVAAAGLANGAAEDQLSEPGGRYPIDDIDDPKYQTLAKLVVEIHNWQANSHLHFQEAVCGWSQITKGTLYQFCLRLIDKDNDNAKVRYITQVVVDPTDNISIVFFNLVPNDLECCYFWDQKLKLN